MFYPDVFIPAPTRLLWEAFSYAAIMRENYSITFPAMEENKQNLLKRSSFKADG